VLYCRNVTDEVLFGGIEHAGRVVRSGPHVLRPSNRYTESIHQVLKSLRSHGFHGASNPVGVDADGRERLVYIEGDVPLPPYPDWAQTDDLLVSITALMRGLHDASEDLALSRLQWNVELADPHGGPVLCHNDVCLENVVFRDGRAVALLDFDFAAPGRRAFDLATFARLCVPIDDPKSAARLGWSIDDAPGRLRLVADAYGVDAGARGGMLEALDWSMKHGGEFVRRRVETGKPGYTQMWEAMGGAERYDRRRRWWERNRDRFVTRLVD